MSIISSSSKKKIKRAPPTEDSDSPGQSDGEKERGGQAVSEEATTRVSSCRRLSSVLAMMSKLRVSSHHRLSPVLTVTPKLGFKIVKN
jgi:hypothetical protein